MKEENRELPIEITMFSNSWSEEGPNFRRDTVEGVRKDTVFTANASGRVVVQKGREDLGENPSLTTGVGIVFSDTDGKEYQFSTSSPDGIVIVEELQSLIEADKEKAEGVQVKAGQPLLRIPGDNQIVIFTRERLQS